MKKIYNLLVLAVLMIAGTAGARAQDYYAVDPSSGDNVTEIEEGVDYAIMSARYANSYLCGDKISNSINAGCMYRFVKNGTDADGDQLWNIKRVQDNKYLLGTDNVPAGQPAVSYTDTQDLAFLAHIHKARYFASVPAQGTPDYEEYNKDKYVTMSEGGDNAWIILEEHESIHYLALWSGDGAAHLWGYIDTNALRIVKVKLAENADLVSSCMADVCPNGLGGFTPGNGIGQCDQAALDEATEAYAACEELVNTDSKDTEACKTAADRLRAAMEALKASIKSLTPGYYYMVNLGRSDAQNGAAMPYNVDGDDYILWDYKSNSIPAKVNADFIPYVWHFTKNGDVWNIQNVVTGKYIGEEEGMALSWRLPATDTPFDYNINVCTDLKDGNEQPISGYFNIVNPTHIDWACHAQVNGKNIVYWNPASGAGNHGSAWTFVEVEEADLQAALDEYGQDKLQADIATLIEEAESAYNGSKSYLSEAAPYDKFADEPGLVTPDQTGSVAANVTSNAVEPSEGSLDNLFDGDVTSYFHSMWSTTPNPNGYHYLQIDLGAAYKSLVMKYARRHNTSRNTPTEVTIQSADNVDGPYTDELSLTTTYTFPVSIPNGNQEPTIKNNWGGMAGFEMTAPHRFIRIVVKKTETMDLEEGYPFFSWSELRLHEGKGIDEENSLLTFINQADANAAQTLLDAVSDAKAALEGGSATQAVLDELQAAYDGFNTVANTVQQPYTNQLAHTRLTAELAAVQSKLDEAKTTIATECKDVAADFVEAEQAIQTDIDAILSDINAQYEAGALTAESSISTADIEAAIEKLLTDAAAAQEEFDNNADKTKLTEGYYYMVNFGRTDEQNGAAMPYNVKGDDYVLFNYKGNSIPAKVNSDFIPYVWHFTKNGDTWNIQNVVTGKYIGEDDGMELGWRLPATDSPFAYDINACTVQDENGQPLTGYFNIISRTNSGWACHPDRNLETLVYWHPATADDNPASAWRFEKVNEADVSAALNEYRQDRLPADLSALIEEAEAAYNGSKSYLSEAAPYDKFVDEPGLVTPDRVSSNAVEPTEGSIENLFDGDVTTFFHSMWSTTPDPNGYHYLQIDLGAAYKSLVMKYARRNNDGSGSPTEVTIQSADNINGPYTDEVNLSTTYTFPVIRPNGKDTLLVKENGGGMAGFEMAAPHRFIRIVVKKTESKDLQDGYPFFYWSELRLHEGNGIDEKNSLLTFINQADANAAQALLDAVSNAKAALTGGTATLATLDELQAAYDGFNVAANAVQQPYTNQLAHTRLTAELATVQSKLDEAKATVATECKDVAADFAEAERGIQYRIDTALSDINAKYEATALTTTESSVNIRFRTIDIEATIEKLLTDAAAAQKVFANNAANTKLTAEITALQTKLDEAKATVDAECKDVAADFTKTEQDIQKMIDQATDSVKTQFEAVALTEESTLHAAGSINTAIEKLLADATAAQKVFANNAANTKLTAEIAALQAKLDEAKATVDAECKDVAADFTKTEHDIQGMIDQAADSVKTQFDAVALNEESTLHAAGSINAAIEKLLADARAAQQAYDQTDKTANEIAYRRLMNELAEVQDMLYAAEAKVDNECPDVSADFVATELGIQDMIDAISDELKKQYEAEALTEESTINTADIEAAIEKLLSDAAAAQMAYEKAANEAAYVRLTNDLAALQSKLDEAKATVETDCKDVAADFAETVEGIQSMIDGIAADLKEQYDAIELTEESTLDTADVEAAIEKLLADAAEAQKAHEIETGIDSLESLAAQNVKIYTVSGKLVNTLVKGQVNILVYPDGTVKRVYVK